MKTIITGMLALILALISGLTVLAQEQTQPRLVTVTGEAEVRVVPDEVILTLGVETWDKSLAAAKGQNDERVKKVLAVASAAGIEPRAVQTDHISIEPRYRDSYTQADFVGYYVRQTIVITLKDIAKFEGVLTQALEAGANYVHGVQFRTSDLRKYRDQARALAITAAQEKATALAGALGQKVGRPYAIKEEDASWRSWYNAWWGSGWGSMTQNVIQSAGGEAPASGGTVAVGEITVNARVSVSFEME